MNRLDLIATDDYDLSIVQGATYEKLIIKLTGDYSSATFKAEIRNTPLESGGTLLASFGFQQIAYDAVANKTTVVPFLTGEQTSAIPFTKFDGTGEATKRNCWLWDMEAVRSGKPEKIVQLSLVQVVAEVTD